MYAEIIFVSISNGSEIPSMSILKLFVDTFGFLKKGSNYSRADPGGGGEPGVRTPPGILAKKWLSDS